MSDDDLYEGEYINDGDDPWEGLIPAGRQVDAEETLPELTEGIPTLGDLLRTYNGLIGWTQTDLAQAIGSDQANVSKIMSGRIQRPHETTLQTIAAAYRNAGLTGVTADQLLLARDHAGKPDHNPFDIPAHWLRPFQTISLLDQERQDALYRVFSTILREFAATTTTTQPHDE